MFLASNLRAAFSPTALKRLPIALLTLALVPAAGCGGSKGGNNTTDASQGGIRAQLQSIKYGRLVDIYAWRRTGSSSDRLNPENRVSVLVEQEVLVNPVIFNDDVFSNASAEYHYMPYDADVGHRELLILWDDQNIDEKSKFDRAVTKAKAGLVDISPFFAFSTDNRIRPPVVPADAAIELTFSKDLGVSTGFFDKQPLAVQVLEIVGDPEVIAPTSAYGIVASRVISKDNGRRLIIDPEVSGREAKGRTANPRGLPPSRDAVANLRIALPTSGAVSKTMRISPDRNNKLNSIGFKSERVVIRDFRVANRQDQNFGNLPDVDSPEIVARKTMGLMAIDKGKRMITVNKRFADVVFRPRIPFVIGPISEKDGKPLGPLQVPQGRPLQNGDVIFQIVLSAKTQESVVVKAEVIRNLAIIDTLDSTRSNEDKIGTGGGGPVAQLIVSTLEAVDSKGNVVSFQASDEPLGADMVAIIHYHDQIPLQNGKLDVGDAGRRAEFVDFNPAPARLDQNRNLLPPNENILPTASLTIQFSKPMSMDTVRTEDNLVIANQLGHEIEFVDHIKIGNMAIVPTLPADLRNDAMSVRLSTALGFFHRKNATETYYFYVKDGKNGLKDRAGNPIELFDFETNIDAVKFDFKLSKSADDNLVGSIVKRMNAADEDGTTTEDVVSDWFGQFQHLTDEGVMIGSPTIRFSRQADGQTLTGPHVQRGNRGECPAPANAAPFFLQLYSTPFEITPAPPFRGGLSEPHIPQGSRMQMTYREDDFSLSNRLANDMEIDIEQLYWAPFTGRQPNLLSFDVFDQYTMVLAHAEKRPDIRVVGRFAAPGPPPVTDACLLEGGAGGSNPGPRWVRSGLTTNFEGNYLDNTTRVKVISDQIYTISPGDRFTAASGEIYISYPKFERSYTWRDRRIVAWDTVNNTVIGLGGAQNPTATPPADDATYNVTTPWLPELDDKGVPLNEMTGRNVSSGYTNMQADDFQGAQVQDHHPVALPLLVDIKLWPDEKANGTAKGDNLFMVAMVGGRINPFNVGQDYYNRFWPWMRVHSTGGIDPQNRLTQIDPENERIARGGWLSNAFPTLGLFQSPPGDGHLHWAQADFVRKHSVITSGYFDLLKPSMNDITPPAGWQGARFGKDGFPNFSSIFGGNLRASDFSVLISPGPEDLPVGTKVDLEFRGAENFDNSNIVYRPIAKETAKNRGNLLSPDYACEQFRYAGTKRVAASGLTNYVKDVDLLLDAKTLVAPRFINLRLTLTNNDQIKPAAVPRVSFLAIQYRMSLPQ